MFDIIDRHTGKKVGETKTQRAAIRSVDKRDLEYGACRYYFKRRVETPVSIVALGKKTEFRIHCTNFLFEKKPIDIFHASATVRP